MYTNKEMVEMAVYYEEQVLQREKYKGFYHEEGKGAFMAQTTKKSQAPNPNRPPAATREVKGLAHL